MAAAKKMHSRDVLRTDELVGFWERVQAYGEEHARRLTIIVVSVVLVAALVWVWNYRRTQQEIAAQDQLSAAMELMAKAAADQEQRQATYEQAVARFTDTTAAYGGTCAGAVATFFAGTCLFELGRYAEARTRFEVFLDRAGGAVDYLVPLAYENIGYCYEQQQQYAEALAWFAKQQQTGGAGAAHALLNLARCHEAQGAAETACRLYREYATAQPMSAFAELARAKSAALCGAS